MPTDSERCCPRCGHITHEGRYCLYCGYDFSLSLQGTEANEYFTGAECGILGLVAGLQIGAAIGLSAVQPDPTLILAEGAAGAAFGAASSGWLGYRLAKPVQQSFRRILLALCAAGLGALIIAIGGWGNVDTVFLSAIGLTAFFYMAALYAVRHSLRKGDEDGFREY